MPIILHHNRIKNFLRNSLRRPLAVLLIASAILTAPSPLVSNASAKVSVPIPGAMIMTWGFPMGRPCEVCDFKPHFGLLPITIGSPVPWLGRGLWCYGPIYVFGWCVPLPFNWCEDFFECLMTNVVNLEATLYIKHAWPTGDGRMANSTNSVVLKPDRFYRDICITPASLRYNRFDPKTGELITPHVEVTPATTPPTYTNIPADTSAFDERATGTVLGARPSLFSCMPRMNNQQIELPTSGTSAFSYYMNARNDKFLRSASIDSANAGHDSYAPITIYGASNRYFSTTFFLGGRLGCPPEVYGAREGTSSDPIEPRNAAEWKAAASRCYNYFILQRATHPEWTLERNGPSTDDPLTYDANRGGDPELAIFNSCQPLVNGNSARLIAEALAAGNPPPVSAGFAEVLQYQRPDLDEAEYSVVDQLNRSFRLTFPDGNNSQPNYSNVNPPVYQNIYPCVRNMSDAGPMMVTDWENFNNTLIINYAISFMVETSVLDKNWGPQYFVPISNYDAYSSIGQGRAGFCPNVEKINVPTHPFAPRDDYRPSPRTFADKFARMLELVGRANLDQFSFGNPNTEIYATDREYSFQTNVYTPRDRIFNTWEFSYSGFNPTMTSPPTVDPAVQMNSLKHPEVQCAIVPVDIMEPRRRAFDNCIMQRINFNFTTWRRRNFLSYYYRRTLPEWRKPCVTRFYESDNYADCPVSMSIQQCCRILVKDVVPMNYVKIRPCEGMRAKRSMIFGFDHLYDYTEQTLISFRDDYAISVATTDAEREAARNILYTATFNTPVPIESQGGQPVRPVTSMAAYDDVFLLNQKLTMVGCDNTEARELRFSHYFPLSDWTEIPADFTRPITDGLTLLQTQSDNAIATARNEANTTIFGSVGVIGTAWDGFNTVKTLADSSINFAKARVDNALAEERAANTRAINAANALYNLTKVTNVILLADQVIPAGVVPALIDEAAAAGLDLAAKKLIVTGEMAAYILVKDAQENIIRTAENLLRDGITAMLQAREAYIIANGKAAADALMTAGVSSLRTTFGAPASNFIDSTLSATYGNDVSAAAAIQLGEGGAHMPYMRLWDTGTSSGNPLHGGSFINTLGSYDTVVGVGHEERNFYDATDVVTEIDARQDAGAIDAALRRLSAARTAEAAAKYAYENPWACWWGCDPPYGRSCGRYWHCPCMPCLLAAWNAAKAELAAAEQQLYDARHSFVATERQTTTAANIDPRSSLTQTARTGKINGWEGIKGHQMWTLRRFGLNCIGRYEKLFKPLAQEDFVLARAGANYTSKTGVQWPWPLGWRGYVADPNNEFERNPNPLSTGPDPARLTGLDDAEAGDLIIYTINGIKRISYVAKVNKVEPRFVKIEGWNQGKFPTAAGISTSAGLNQQRTIYKTEVPTRARSLRIVTLHPTSPTEVPRAPTINDELIRFLPPTDLAKIGDNNPSCEDPEFTSCVLGGEGIRDTNGVLIPNSVWDNVKIYRPSADTAQRQCPMINTASGAGGPDLNTSKLATDSFSYCVNAGFDPPSNYVIGYNGAGTGAVQDLTLCGPKWGECDNYAAERSLCFPGRQVCETAADAPPPPPPPPPSTECTAEQWRAAQLAYRDAMNATADALTTARSNLGEAENRVEGVTSDYQAYYNSTAEELATLNAAIRAAEASGSTAAERSAIAAATTALNTAITNYNNAVAAAQPANDALRNYINANRAAVDADRAILQAAEASGVDPENYTATQMAAFNELQAIETNTATLTAATETPNAAVDAARQAVVDAQNYLNSLPTSGTPTTPPDPAMIARRDAINAERARLQGLIATANQAVTDAQAAVVAAQAALDDLPPLSCPWPPGSTPPPPPPPPPPPGGPVPPPDPLACTPAQEAAAQAAYDAAVQAANDRLNTAENAISDADALAEQLNRAYLDYFSNATARLAEIEILIANATVTATASVTAAQTTLNNAITDLRARQAIVDRNYADYNATQRTNFPAMNPVQLVNYINRARRNIAGCQATPPTYTGCTADNTAALQADVNRYQSALDSFNNLNAIPLADANAARQAVWDAQAALDALTSSMPTIAAPDPALVAERDAINAELSRLQAELDAANAAVAARVSDADAAEAARLAVPAYSCPYPPAP